MKFFWASEQQLEDWWLQAIKQVIKTAPEPGIVVYSKQQLLDLLSISLQAVVTGPVVGVCQPKVVPGDPFCFEVRTGAYEFIKANKFCTTRLNSKSKFVF